MTESGFENAVVTKPMSEGIEVSREFQDAKGNPVRERLHPSRMATRLRDITE